VGLNVEGPSAEKIPFGYADFWQPIPDECVVPATPLALYKLREKLYSENYSVGIDEDVIRWFERENDVRGVYEQPTEPEIPHAMYFDNLYRHQQDGVKFLYRNSLFNNGRVRALIADDPRLGKSAQALAFFHLWGLDGPLLILCPKILIHQWEEYCQQWLPRHAVYILEGDASVREGQLRKALHDFHAPTVLTNWEALHMDIPSLRKTSWRGFIGDEAHRLKNRKSATAQLTKSLKRWHTILLSATFLEKDPSQYWAPLNIVHPGRWSSFWRFVGLYCKTSYNGFGIDIEGAANSDLMREALSPYIIERKVTEVADMPDVVQDEIVCNLAPRHRDFYDKVRSDVLLFINDDVTAPQRMTRLGMLRQLCIHPSMIEGLEGPGTVPSSKLEALRLLVENTLHSEEQVVVFSSYVEGCIRANSALNSSGVVVAGNKGGPSAIEAFQEGKYRVLCTTPERGGVGLNLYNADWVIFLDMPWSSVLLRQASNRVVISGKKTVGIYYIVARGTVDEYVYRLMQHKLRHVKQGSLSLVEDTILEHLVENQMDW
jgi:SNF2 family DNA or RNA helicase